MFSPPAPWPIPPPLPPTVFSPKHRETRKPRGFTFCQYRRREDAAEAVKGMDKRVGPLCVDYNKTMLVCLLICVVSMCVTLYVGIDTVLSSDILCRKKKWLKGHLVHKKI